LPLVYWYQAPGVLKLMMTGCVRRGGNPDPTSTHGKRAAEAKALELAGGPIPNTLRAVYTDSRCMATSPASKAHGAALFGLAGLDGLIDAGFVRAWTVTSAISNRMPKAIWRSTADTACRRKTRNVARAVVAAVGAIARGKLTVPDAKLKNPPPK